ncbi:hypothetical protein HO291_003471 [Salmonella enterica]|nr:hypothetical protein [Salmonella enterica]
MSVFFNGQLLETPTTASAVNDDAMLNQNLSVGNAVVYIGESDGGEDHKLYSFGNPDEALKVLASGELCAAVTAAFSPSEETGSPQTVHAIRVNPYNPATLTIPLAVRGVIDTKKAVFGTLVGLLNTRDDLTTRVKFEAGTADPSYITVTASGKRNGQDWTYSAVDVTEPRIVVEVLENNCAWQGGANLCSVTTDMDDTNLQAEVDMYASSYATLGEVADVANGVTNHAGKKVVNITFVDDADRALPMSVLDDLTVSTVPTTSIPSPAPKTRGLPWNGWSIKTWFDTYLAEIVRLDLDETADGVLYRNHGPQVADFKYLVRPKDPLTLPTHWTEALSMLQTVDVQWVHAVTGDEAVHAAVKAHVDVCSNVLRRERRAICGTPSGTTDDDAIKRAKSLNSKRVSLVHIGHYAYNAAGKLALRPPYMTAGLVAAAFAGVNPGTPLTNKTLNVLGLERDLRNPTDTDKLLKGGVLPIENTETGYKVTQSITTWLVDSKYNNREQSCGVAVDFAIRNVRQAVDPLRGSKQTPILLSRAVSLTKGALTELSRPEPQGPAVLVGDENSPAWRNVTATIAGDVLRIQFEASPVIPNNYILVTMYAVPYSGSATA